MINEVSHDPRHAPGVLLIPSKPYRPQSQNSLTKIVVQVNRQAVFTGVRPFESATI